MKKILHKFDKPYIHENNRGGKIVARNWIKSKEEKRRIQGK